MIDCSIYWNGKKTVFRLTKDVNVSGYIIKEGYVTDFASVPSIFWSILPPLGRHNKAALLHDWLYDNQIGTRNEADNLFLKQMKLDNVPSIQRNIMYYGVKFFALKWWKK